jgi:hypothetical protein
LLDLAYLDKNERIMIQASMSNARDFEKVADALIAQHPRAHVRVQRRRDMPHKKFEGEGAGNSSWKKLSGKGSYRRAYLADDDDQCDAKTSGMNLPTIPLQSRRTPREG